MIAHIHDFIKSEEYAGYEYCPGCGSYHSIEQVDPKIIYEGAYWSHENNRSTIEEQVYNITETETAGISKIDFILKCIPKSKNSLEIACAPGVLLNKLSEISNEAYGIEPNSEYLDFICEQAPKAVVLHGYFPAVFDETAKNCFDSIIGMDIFEHIDDYDKFIKAVLRLLSDGGRAVFMSPIILEDGLFRERDFKPDEHCWIHSKKFLDPYLKQYFKGVFFDRWQIGHEVIILTK